jgi:hypothetical protein
MKWEGNKVKSNGYRYIRDPHHPQANKHGYVPEHRSVYEDSRKCCLLCKAVVHHRDRDKTNNVWYNLMAMLPYEHSKIHHPRYFDALCRCESRNVYGRRRRDGNEHLQCNDCGECWYISISELQIMLKEGDVIKNPRMSIESLGLRCVCGSIEILRKGTRNGKQRIDCKTCHKTRYIPKLDVNKHRLSKRKSIIQTTQNKPHMVAFAIEGRKRSLNPLLST